MKHSEWTVFHTLSESVTGAHSLEPESHCLESVCDSLPDAISAGSIASYLASAFVIACWNSTEIRNSHVGWCHCTQERRDLSVGCKDSQEEGVKVCWILNLPHHKFSFSQGLLCLYTGTLLQNPKSSSSQLHIQLFWSSFSTSLSTKTLQLPPACRDEACFWAPCNFMLMPRWTF